MRRNGVGKTIYPYLVKAKAIADVVWKRNLWMVLGWRNPPTYKASTMHTAFSSCSIERIRGGPILLIIEENGSLT